MIDEEVDPEPDVARAAADVAGAEAALTRALAALARAKSATQQSRTTQAAVALASEALQYLSPNDLDEVRAIRGSPPAIVQQVVCCVCSVLALADDVVPTAAADSQVQAAAPSTGAGTSMPVLPSLSPTGHVSAAATTTRWRQALAGSTRTTDGLMPWPEAQKRVGQKGFKQALTGFDSRRLLAPDAAKVVQAVSKRIAIADEGGTDTAGTQGSARGTAGLPGSPSKKGASGLLTRGPAASASSIAAVAAAARRARLQSLEERAESGPLTLQDASRGSFIIGALFLWCSRALANAEQVSKWVS